MPGNPFQDPRLTEQRSDQALPAQPTLLVLDYPGRRPEAHVSEMHLDQGGFDSVYALTPPLPTALTTPAYARQLCERLRPDRPVAVVSYCAAAPLAIAMAGLLAGPAGSPLPITFLNPSQTQPYDIAREYAAAVAQIEGRAPDIKRPPLLDIERLLATPEMLVRRIETDLRLRATLALAAFGFDGADASGPTDTVVGIYVDWLTFLVAAHHCEQPVPNGQFLQVISEEEPADVSWLGGADLRTVRIACDRLELAMHAETRAAVLGFLRQFALSASATPGYEELGHAG